MIYRYLPNSNVQVSEIGFGSWPFDKSFWGDYDINQAKKAFHFASMSGINFVDTAFAYGNGYVEEFLGKMLRDLNLRDKFFIATKIPSASQIWIPSPHIHADDAFPKHHIIHHTEQSLINLKVDYLDLQQLHVWSSMWLGEGEWLETLYRLKEQGKILNIGVSIHDHDPDSVIQLVKSGYIDFVQLHFNIFDQSPSLELFDICKQNKVGIIVRSPLYEGVLTDSFLKKPSFSKADWRNDYFSGGHLEECLSRCKVLADENKNVSITELALKFVLSFDAITTVLIGARNPLHILNNAKISDGNYMSESQLFTLKGHSWLNC
jgi:aryl-alcohol dehydrogenase-like predicted oxidoreductase